MVADFKKRYGLDYLKGPPAEQAERKIIRGKEVSGDLPLGLEEALIAYGRRVLEELKSEPEKSAKILDLTSRLTIRIDVLLPVVQYLLSRGFLSIILPDPQGNDTLKLTEAGTKLLD